LARHGETAWNVTEVFRGQSNVDLNDTGLKQAELLANYLSDVDIQAIYSSPLQRTYKTAQAIASRHNLQVIPVEGLNDMNFGVWEGVPVAEVNAKYPKLFADWIATPHLVQIPGGDTFDEVAKRSLTFVDEVLQKHDGTVVLVSHRVVHMILILRLLGLDVSHFWNIKLGTAAITTFTYEKLGFCLNEHNNTSYLDTLKDTGK
jgi:phosphoserine phosphatase